MKISKRRRLPREDICLRQCILLRFALRADRLHSNLADQDLIYLKVPFVNKDLKHQVQAVIKRTGLRNISVYYMNGQSSSAIFTPPKEKQSCPPNCETCTCSVKRNKCLTLITCSFCEKVYIGESGRTIDSRIKEHRMNKQSIVQLTTAKHPRSTVTMLIYA